MDMRHFGWVLLGLGMNSLAGCCTVCPAHNVPVSLEPLYNFVTYYDAHCAWHYPYSCPPCPYPDPGAVSWLGYHAAEAPAEPELLETPAPQQPRQPTEQAHPTPVP